MLGCFAIDLGNGAVVGHPRIKARPGPASNSIGLLSSAGLLF
jgi:hypothetical protein